MAQGQDAEASSAEASSAEVSSWLLQAKAFLDDARQLRPGPARDELLEVARVLREIARLEAQSGPRTELDQPGVADPGESPSESTPRRINDLGRLGSAG